MRGRLGLQPSEVVITGEAVGVVKQVSGPAVKRGREVRKRVRVNEGKKRKEETDVTQCEKEQHDLSFV